MGHTSHYLEKIKDTFSFIPNKQDKTPPNGLKSSPLPSPLLPCYNHYSYKFGVTVIVVP